MHRRNAELPIAETPDYALGLPLVNFHNTLEYTPLFDSALNSHAL
ncbi:MAG: hypothetical protein JWO19_4483 [Bryobacterales bacterium]|nr:hypothetical protein [Bryobacterales bacterium]